MCTSNAVRINSQIAQRLEEAASILETQYANPYRVDAYRRAALTIRNLNEPAPALLERAGLEGLLELPGVGDRLALTIRDIILTGRFPLLEHLRGEVDTVALLQSVPGIGRVQAERLHRDLGIDSLEDLESAAHDGRLASVAGFGAKRIAGIVDSLASRLGRVGRPQIANNEIPIAELLDVDREYRDAVQAGRLHKIAPRRFNPTGEAWLPIFHTDRHGRHYTALFSNTARAHQLRRTRDWVILYEDGTSESRQYTVITARHGALEGKRIVRGRESECREFYDRANSQGLKEPLVWTRESPLGSRPPETGDSPQKPHCPGRSELL
jgi:putative hydrolase